MKLSETGRKIHKAEDLILSDLPAFEKLPPPKGYRRKELYNKQICAFDIETTTLPSINQSFIYIWQFAIEDFVIVGRSWDQFKRLLKLLKVVTGGRKTVVFVHNLSYEIVWLSGLFHFENEDIFCTESRKVLKANIGNLEFRCSYRLTNLDLKSLTRRYNVQHQKLSGEEFDYSAIRYPWTELTDQQIDYCVNDVLGLIESMHAILDLNNDDLYSLPLTSTGFVRRECKKAMQSEHVQIMQQFPDYEVFSMLRAEFRGGNTHANRYLVDEVIDEPVTSMDISSSYPSQMCCKLFPASPFKKLVAPNMRLIDRLIETGRCVLFEVELYDVELRNKYIAVPYIPIAKCKRITGYLNDNGRVLRADYLSICVNEHDWKIIVNQYKFRAEVVKGFKAKAGPLPEGLRACNIEFFKKKTELKGLDPLYYAKNKELLNSIYGMSVQNIAKPNILFNDGAYEEDYSENEEQRLIRAKKRAFTCYQFGCWTTSLARESLQAGIDICGDDLLYVDTDSCKFIGKHDFTHYNEEQEQLALRSGLYATDKDGVVHFGGVFEFDGCYKRFITQGAKKYCYEDETGLHVTVSGVGKKQGRQFLEAHGGIEAFREGFVFENCGKTRSIYNDDPYGVIEIDGHQLDIIRNVVIEDQDYTLSRTYEYSDVILQSKRYLYRALQNFRNVQNV